MLSLLFSSLVQQIELSYASAPPAATAGRDSQPADGPAACGARTRIDLGGRQGPGLSYRHVWGELKRWEAELGHPLVIVWDKGQPAQLSEFGDKLLWAERQAQARLAPQIEALHADLERAFAARLRRQHARADACIASHDDALVALREHAAASARLHLDIRFTGSVDAISALTRDAA